MSKLAGELDERSTKHLESHETFELAETLFHISIAVVAIAVVAKRKEFWYVSMVGGAIGLGFFGWALANAPHEPKPKTEVVATQPAEHPVSQPAAPAASAPG